MKASFSLVFIALLLACSFVPADALLKIGFHEDACNSGSKQSSGRKTIYDQLGDAAFGCEVTGLKDSEFTLSNLKNYDVIYLGAGGKDLDDVALSPAAAQAIYNYVAQGGGLVISSTSANAFKTYPDSSDSPRTILNSLFPFDVSRSAWVRASGSSEAAWVTLNQATNHYIVTHQLPYSMFLPLSYTFVQDTQIKSGWTSLATMDPEGLPCCEGLAGCGSEMCSNHKDQVALARDIGAGAGRVVYISYAFCGYEQFAPFNLRSGEMNILFHNALSWASKKCTGSDECNGHGYCSGSSGTCLCDEGWEGSTCNVPHCDNSCGEHGTCTGPNVCTCDEGFRGSMCDLCAYPKAGDNCEKSMIFEDPSFENCDISSCKWSFIDTSFSNAIVTSSGSVTPRQGLQFVKLTASSSGVGVSQSVFVSQWYEKSPYIRFYYQKTATSSSGKLEIYVDNTLVRTIQSTDAVTSWTPVFVDLLAYSTEEGVEHTIKFIAKGSSSDIFYLDLADILYFDCDPACHYGICYVDENQAGHCHCDDHHSGDLCQYPRCGDGKVMSPEECDDGNTNDGDGCSSSCKIETGWTCPDDGGACSDICGDGRTMSSDPRACDDGNTVDGDGCGHDCKWETHFKCTQSKTSRSVCSIWCGDGLVKSPEVCDVAAGGAGAAGCSADCSDVNEGWECTTYSGTQNSCFQHVCGDGARTSDEECDDGNKVNGDGCDSNCKIEEGFVISIGSRGKLEKSIMQPICGDGRTVQGEVCDSGTSLTYRQSCVNCTAVKGFHCEVVNFVSTCRPQCGDGVRTEFNELGEYALEECDDGNNEDGDGCSHDCKLEIGFVCNDDENNKTSCVKADCGNGHVESGETCDLGDFSSVGCVGCKTVLGYTCTETECHGTCGDGYVTEGEACDAGRYAGCKDDCSGKMDGFTCTVEERTDSKTKEKYRVSVCTSACGNGHRAQNEECDDGNNLPGDGCSGYCKVEDGWHCTDDLDQLSVCTSTCGDGIRVGTEECDDGNTKDGDGCSSTCTIETGYKCPISGGVCEPICGDGLLIGSEQCDDNNTRNGDGCSDKCKVESGWTCRQRADGISECMKPGCGNGQVSWEEDCDDGNNKDGDGCSSKCKLEDPTNVTTFECILDPENWTTVCREIKCGNGKITADEECDDGNNNDGDGCDSKCKLEKNRGFDCEKDEPTKCRLLLNVCGTGYKDYGEECDDGNLINGDGCSDHCTIEDDWYCEVKRGAGQLKWSECRRIVCGDGLTDPPEQCDDGNTQDGDGCSSKCQAELGYNCVVRDFKSRCTAGCGNGKKSDDEECDDGNFINGDGCSSQCQIEHGFQCIKDPACIKNCGTVCYSTCGDGNVSSDEECDDGNLYSGDGCGPDCRVETSPVGLWMCYNEPSECEIRECNLSMTVTSTKNVTCYAGQSGSIEIDVVLGNSKDTWVARVWREGGEKGEFEVASVFKNLPAGKYMIEVHVDGFDKCQTSESVTLSEPKQLRTNKNSNQFWDMLKKAPSCDGSDGRFTWPVVGGTDPKQYTFGPFNNTDGKFTGLSMSTFYNYRPRVTDAHGCVLDLEDVFYKQFPDPDKTCQKGEIDQFLADLWDTGGPEGLIIIACTFLAVIILGIGYCCWSNDKQVPRSAQRPPPKK